MWKVIKLILLAFWVSKVVPGEIIHFDAVRRDSSADIHEGNTDFSTVEREFNEAESARIRRATPSKERRSCETSSQCSGNEILFETTSSHYNCHCDNACYQTFQDCCPDYVDTCGEQEKSEANPFEPLWKCLKPDKTRIGYGHCYLSGPTGIWMVASCQKGSPFDETRARCENVSKTFSFPIEDFLPVVGENGFTFRNKHCALCNGEKIYTTWDIMVKGFIIPPDGFNIDEKLKFTLANGGYVQYIAPGVDLPRRYCAGVKYKENCTSKFHPAYTSCNDGPVATVTGSRGLYYKNVHCAFCFGEAKLQETRSDKACGAPGGLSDGFSIVFNRGSKGSTTVTRVVETYCPQGLVYDTTLDYCREGLVTNAEDILSDVFLIALWFKQGSIGVPTPTFFNPFLRRLVPIPNINNITEHLKSGLVQTFALKSNQIHELKFHRQNFDSTFLVATFRLTLTPFQELILANQNNTDNLNISTDSLKFLGILKFTTNFTMHAERFRFPVVKLLSKQLACFEGIMLKPHEYETDEISGNVFQNRTGMHFSRNEYAVLGNVRGNITICRKLLLGGCENGAYVVLNNSEYFIYENLSIFHQATNKSYKFGEYQVIEESSTYRNGLESFPQNASFPVNSTIAVCLPFRRTFNTTETTSTKSQTNFALRVLTIIGFSISVLFLIILLVTYGIFKELRTLPGLNLMSLSISMLSSHLIWLIGTAHFKDTRVCEVLAVIEHYLFLVTFMAMSVISYHSCVVFSQIFGGNSSNSLGRFAKYAGIVWLTPAIFIAVCVTLDRTESTFDIYDTTCWLSTDEAVLYLFLLPAGMLLLGNIYTFIRTALALSRYNRDTRILQKDRKQNLIVCAKLATLVGFPWLFAFLGVIFPNIEAFEYLFVVFACLQGFYISVAFVCNKKTFQLYRKWWRSVNRVSTGSEPKNQTYQMS